MPALRAVSKAGWKVLVPIGIGTVAVVPAVKGAVDAVDGYRTRKAALKGLDEAVARCEDIRLNVDRVARDYGDIQARVHKETVVRFADWLERNEYLVKRLDSQVVDGVVIQVPSVPQYVADAEAVTTGAIGLVSAVGAGLSARAGALWGVSTFGSASTGTAIASLRGAAAEKAIRAWFGGGSVAAGGGGEAAGKVVLGLVMIVPALLVGGMTIGVVGARTKTKARDFAATATLRTERLGLAEDLLGAVERRVQELRDLLGQLADRAAGALDVLESLDFDPNLHAREFLRVLQLVTAVKEVLNTPVLDPESGLLTEASVEILRRYE